MNDIEKNLAGYLIVVTMINAALGAIVALGAWLARISQSGDFRSAGRAVELRALCRAGGHGGGLVRRRPGHLSLARPRVPRAVGFVALTTTEGHFITPTIVGRRLTLNPLLVLLALAFWTWMWGPFGAFLAAPLSIIGLVVFNHLFPADDVKLPD